MNNYFEPPLPHVFAHRGLALRFEENSLGAFEDALDAGATHIETDIHVTADMIPVLAHDLVVNGATISRTYFNDLPGNIHKLEDALKRFPTARFNLDIKNSHGIEAVFDTIVQAQASNRVLITSFSDRRRRRAKKGLPSAAMSTSSLSFLAAFLAAKLRIQPLVNVTLKKFDAVQIPTQVLGMSTANQHIIHSLHIADVYVYYWTINTPDEIAHLLSLGADGVVTDRTDVAVETMKKIANSGHVGPTQE